MLEFFSKVFTNHQELNNEPGAVWMLIFIALIGGIIEAYLTKDRS